MMPQRYKARAKVPPEIASEPRTGVTRGNSLFGNPVKMEWVNNDRIECLRLYRLWLAKDPDVIAWVQAKWREERPKVEARGKKLYDKIHHHRPPTIEEIQTLKGRHLACTCPLNLPCHADILIELANPELDAGHTNQTTSGERS